MNYLEVPRVEASVMPCYLATIPGASANRFACSEAFRCLRQVFSLGVHLFLSLVASNQVQYIFRFESSQPRIWFVQHLF